MSSATTPTTPTLNWSDDAPPEIARHATETGFCIVLDFFTEDSIPFLDDVASLKGCPLELAQAPATHRLREIAADRLREIGKCFFFNGEDGPMATSHDAVLGNTTKSGRLHHDQVEGQPPALQCFAQCKDAVGACTAIVPFAVGDKYPFHALNKKEPSWRVPDNEEEVKAALEEAAISTVAPRGSLVVMNSRAYHMRWKSPTCKKGTRSSLCLSLRPMTDPVHQRETIPHALAAALFPGAMTHGGFIHGNVDNPRLGFNADRAIVTAAMGGESKRKRDAFIEEFVTPRAVNKKTGAPLKAARSAHYVAGVEALIEARNVDVLTPEGLGQIVDEVGVARKRIKMATAVDI